MNNVNVEGEWVYRSNLPNTFFYGIFGWTKNNFEEKIEEYFSYYYYDYKKVIINTLTGADLEFNQQAKQDAIDDQSSLITDDTLNNNFASMLLNTGNSFGISDTSYIRDFFDTLNRAFTMDEEVALNLTIPFTNTPFHISSSDITSKIPNTFKNFISTLVWGLVVIFIAKDIFKIINLISGADLDGLYNKLKNDITHLF